MNAKRLAEIEQRAAKATPGPLVVDALSLGTIGSVETLDGTCVAQAVQTVSRDVDMRHEIRTANAQFFAHARTDIPDLTAFVRELVAALEHTTQWPDFNEPSCPKCDQYKELLRKYRGEVE